MRTPNGYEQWNPAWRGAFKKGVLAHQAGIDRSQCPYEDKRKWDGRLSWSRAFIATWRDGWDWSADGKA